MGNYLTGKSPLSRVSSPADFSAKSLKNDRRHSSRISSKPFHEPELSSFNESQSHSHSSSLPSTPLASSFDDALHSTKRRKTTQPNSPKPFLVEDGKVTTPQPLDFSEIRDSDRKSAKMHTSNRNTPDVDQVEAADQTVTLQTPNEASKANGSSKEIASATAIGHWDKPALDTLPTDSPQDGQVESLLQKDDSKGPAVSSPGSRSRRSSKKPQPANIRYLARQLRHRSRNTAGVPYEGIEAPRAASQPAPTLRPTALDNDRPKSSQSVEIRDLRTERQSRTAMSTPTFSLNSPRFSQISKDDQEIDSNTQGSRTDVLDDGSSFELDGDTARDSFGGLDGQMDPISSSAASSIILAGIRTSGRSRKPTIRAMESLESQQRLRKVKQNAKVESLTGEATTKDNAATVLQNENSSFPHSGFEQKSNLQRVSERLFEAAMAALLPDFEKSVNGDSVIEEIHKEYDEKKVALDAQFTAKDIIDKTASDGSPKLLEGNKPEESRPSPSKEFILQNHPETEKPWTDEDGWTHTGHTNIYGEEVAVVPESFEWYRPSSSYGADKLPVPPIRFKSRDQVQRDGIFGFPPLAGQRNVPRDVHVPFVTEDVEVEKAKVRARQEARKRDISVHPSMSLEEMRDIVQDYDRRAAVDPSLKRFEPMSPVRSEVGVAERSRRRRRENRSNYPITGRGDSNTEPRSRRRRENHTSLPSPRKAESNQPRARRRRQKAHSLDAPVSETRAGTPTTTTKTTNTRASPPAKSRKRGFAHAEKEDTEKKGESRDSEELPRKRLKLIITRPGMGRELASTMTDANGERQDESAARITFASTDAETVTTPQSTTHSNSNEQEAGETPGGRPKRRAAAAAASATNSQVGGKSRKNNTRKRNEAGSSQDYQDRGDGEDGKNQDAVTPK